MDKSPTNRYIFIDFDNLKKIKVKQLETVCDKAYILVDHSQQSIPLKIVRKIQRFGSNVKWISANTEGANNIHYYIAFLMGKLHKKTNNIIEFVVISDEESIEPMIECINDFGRNCLRINTTKPENTPNSESDVIPNNEKEQFPFEDEKERATLREKIIRETTRRLMNSDNPPTTTEELKQYISLSNQEFAGHINLDIIVEEMIRQEVITVIDQGVVYKFLPVEP